MSGNYDNYRNNQILNNDFNFFFLKTKMIFMKILIFFYIHPKLWENLHIRLSPEAKNGHCYILTKHISNGILPYKKKIMLV